MPIHFETSRCVSEVHIARIAIRYIWSDMLYDRQHESTRNCGVRARQLGTSCSRYLLRYFRNRTYWQSLRCEKRTFQVLKSTDPAYL